MASLTAISSPQQHHQYTAYRVSPVVLGSNVYPVPPHPPCHYSYAEAGRERGENDTGLYLVGGQNPVYFDSDCSSPTGWQFRDSCSMPGVAAVARASSPLVLPLRGGRESDTSSLGTTPSPLDEVGPYHHHHLQLQQCGDSETSCACVFVSSPSNTTMLVGGGGAIACNHPSLELSNGDGSDGSRNSTGSHRSQDSGFSDSGETRRRKSVSVHDHIHHPAQMSLPPHETSHLHLTQSSINGCQRETSPHPGTFLEGECDYERRSNCCSDRMATSPNGVLHQQPIYDCIPTSMPSPILPSGFGCGRLPNGQHPIYGVVLGKHATPPARPASVDISTLDRLSLTPVTSSCSNCLSFPPQVPPPPAQRRSFSPASRRAHHCSSHSNSHDISALASASTATAIAALRVPLSSSTPKRGGGSTSKLIGGHGPNLMVKIDNFTSLNKNVNKDNNNNSSGADKSKNKSFSTLHQFTNGSPPTGTQPNPSAQFRTVFAEGEQGSSGEPLGNPERAPLAGKRTRSAAESIYDKICSRLSSFSSSTSASTSASSSASPQWANTTEELTVQSVLKGCGKSSQSANEECSRPPSRFRLFARTSSAKWQSLPRGVTPQQLSLVEEHKRRSVCMPLGECENNAGISFPADCTSEGLLPPLQSSKSTEEECRSSAWKLAEDKADSQVVRLWLHDLRTQTEPECLHSLQTKWIVPADLSPGEEDEDDDNRTETISRSCSHSPTVTGRTSSSSTSTSTSHHPLTSASPTETYSTSSYPSDPPCLNKDIGIHTWATVTNPPHQRRSQQKFLSSMTAAIHAISSPLMSIRNVEMTASIISGEFSKICKHLEFGVFTQVPTLVISLVGHIEDFLRGGHASSRGPPVHRGGNPGLGFAIHLKKLENRLQNGCYPLDMAAKGMSEAAMVSSSSGSGRGSSNLPPRSTSTSPQESSSSTTSSSSPGNSSDLESEPLDSQYQMILGEVVEGIVTVGNLFSQVVDLRLTRDLALILDTIEGGGIPGRIALKSLVTVLADGGNHMCRLAADIRTVRGLLAVLLDTREDQDKILALRCLATVLCVGEAVKDFDKAGGFEIVADLLYDPIYSLWMKIEAVAVLTQATDPWIDLETTLITLGVHLEKFVRSLTSLIGEFKTEEEPFLLIVAAISNLTFLEVASTSHLKKCRTVSHLINAVKRNPSFSVFVLDHVATILANMAGVEACRQEIIHCGGLDALLHFLQQRPSFPGKTSTASAITACERLQQKSTIAISRLANEEGVARYILHMGGLHRLVTLCRKEKERNYSDGVLIAALATLRKLVTTCGDEALQRLSGAEDLIEPRLLDSFLLYSSRQESYV